MNILSDENFSNGFKLKGLNSIKDGHASIKEFMLNAKEPQWFLCQWNSRYNLINGKFDIEKNRYSIYDDTKKLVVYNNRTITFELDANSEYDHIRKVDEPWPHLLIEQEIKKNNEINKINKLLCHGYFKLLKFEDFMGDNKKEYHTTQFVWVVTLKDNNPKSASFNSFIWVVLCPFDSRYKYVPLFTQQDKALPDGEFIYSFKGEDFINRTLWDKEEVELSIDLYPQIDKILSLAQKRGFMKDTKRDDLVISSTNMGFEITGNYNCKIAVRDLEIII